MCLRVAHPKAHQLGLSCHRWQHLAAVPTGTRAILRLRRGLYHRAVHRFQGILEALLHESCAASSLYGFPQQPPRLLQVERTVLI